MPEGQSILLVREEAMGYLLEASAHTEASILHYICAGSITTKQIIPKNAFKSLVSGKTLKIEKVWRGLVFFVNPDTGEMESKPIFDMPDWLVRNHYKLVFNKTEFIRKLRALLSPFMGGFIMNLLINFLIDKISEEI